MPLLVHYNPVPLSLSLYICMYVCMYIYIYIYIGRLHRRDQPRRPARSRAGADQKESRPGPYSQLFLSILYVDMLCYPIV